MNTKDKLQELFCHTMRCKRVFIHEPTGMKIGVYGDSHLPKTCKEVSGHPPIQVLAHIYVAGHEWGEITDYHVEHLNDVDKLLQLCMQGDMRESMVVISDQVLEVIKGVNFNGRTT